MKNLFCLTIALIMPFSSFCDFSGLSEIYADDERAKLLIVDTQNVHHVDGLGYHYGTFYWCSTEEVLFTHDLLKQTTDINEKRILKSRIRVLLLAYIASLQLAIESFENIIISLEQEQAETTSADHFYMNHQHIIMANEMKEAHLKTQQNVQTFLNSVLAGR